MENPLVSVIISTKNRPTLLLQTIDSILVQTYPSLELVIIDDGSSQSVAPLVAEHLAQHHLKHNCIRHEVSQGLAIARNVGASHSAGQYLYFLDDDDLLVNSALEVLVDIIQEYKLDCVFNNIEPFGQEALIKANELEQATNRVLAGVAARKPREDVYLFDSNLLKMLLLTVPTSFQKGLVTRDFWIQTGGMRPHSELPDSEWAIKAALLGKCGLVLQKLYRWRVDGQNIYSMKKDEYRIQYHVVANMEALVKYGSESAQVGKESRQLLKQALAKSYYDLAWGYREQAEYAKAFQTLLKASSVNFKFRHILFAMKLVLRALTNK